jgi:transposase
METKRVARRNHSAEFRAQVLTACREPDTLVAAIAMRNELNANVIYRWLHEESQKPVTASAEIRMELRRGGSSVTVNWPLQCPTPGHSARPRFLASWGCTCTGHNPP